MGSFGIGKSAAPAARQGRWDQPAGGIRGSGDQGIGGVGKYAVFISPFEFIHGCTLWIFNVSPAAETALDTADFPQWIYPLVVLAYGAAGLALVVRRFDRISA